MIFFYEDEPCLSDVRLYFFFFSSLLFMKAQTKKLRFEAKNYKSIAFSELYMFI